MSPAMTKRAIREFKEALPYGRGHTLESRGWGGRGDEGFNKIIKSETDCVDLRQNKEHLPYLKGPPLPGSC